MLQSRRNQRDLENGVVDGIRQENKQRGHLFADEDQLQWEMLNLIRMERQKAVPYNETILRVFECHCNIEIVAFVRRLCPGVSDLSDLCSKNIIAFYIKYFRIIFIFCGLKMTVTCNDE
ncbi:Hypothetical predicted protein [Octopus vulgaris]|uniref:Uncharacterized protein n=1 Tax=Octopus vulgaris TaxID=6645 RepID=A0AA36BIL7_OCTVU|nr:Hypothetical predicted protein [Octopus vulgaris]